ncbi:GDSL esterase/lipase At3g48460-like [Olea europaea var. sylvestris]|uniref:GDSL esterase lipase At3g48460 n=1 Tax=Olea europaea subsp. europaea TaxID=158383 RepID=A0A8S0T670_OLEEU|nr:GDSL esterase/lipase At3g48460-like [Olea europaea var. sylvestris]CAA3000457.1 GDSL esterase lipase At3g48460 [Olea europaea subsp. europaea]
MTISFAQIILFTITAILIFSTPSTAQAGILSHPFKKVYAFGDAETDTGNTRSATGPTIFRFVSNHPYGQSFFGRPTNRYSDGRLMIDFLAEALSLPYLPPYRNKTADKSHGVNFAYAGSTALTHSFFLSNNLTLNIIPVSLQTQLSWFNEFLEKERCSGSPALFRCKAEYINDALFWVGEMGANDYAYSYRSSVPAETIQELATTRVIEFVQALLNKGAKYILVQGLHPTGCLTLSLATAPSDDRDKMGCVASVNNKIYTHNTILQSKLNNLQIKFPQAIIVYANYWNAFYHVFENSDEYGFNEKFKACCGSGCGTYKFDALFACGSPPSTACNNPFEYLNWDGGHLTEATYKVLADLFINGAYCEPTFSFLLSNKMQSG